MQIRFTHIVCMQVLEALRSLTFIDVFRENLFRIIN